MTVSDYNSHSFVPNSENTNVPVSPRGVLPRIDINRRIISSGRDKGCVSTPTAPVKESDPLNRESGYPGSSGCVSAVRPADVGDRNNNYWANLARCVGRIRRCGF